MDTSRVVIADDHPLFRAALRHAVLQELPDARIVEADNLDQLQAELARTADVDLLLMDLHMPGASGFSGLSHVCSRYPDMPVIMVSANEDNAVVTQAMALGAAAFIPKSASIEAIGEAVAAVLAGDTWLPPGLSLDTTPADVELLRRVGELTPQQFRVLQMIARGMLNKQIAYDLGVSEATVKAHVTAVMRKLGVRTRTQAVLVLQSLELDAPQSSG